MENHSLPRVLHESMTFRPPKDSYDNRGTELNFSSIMCFLTHPKFCGSIIPEGS